MKVYKRLITNGLNFNFAHFNRRQSLDQQQFTSARLESLPRVYSANFTVFVSLLTISFTNLEHFVDVAVLSFH